MAAAGPGANLGLLQSPADVKSQQGVEAEPAAAEGEPILRQPAAIALVAVALTAAACTTSRETNPKQTATEQLLVSKAVDDAVRKIDLPIPAGTRVYLDTSGIDGPNAKYAAAALRARLLTLGADLAPTRDKAKMVVEARAGALSIDKYSTLVGIPSFDIPIPLTGKATVPELALYKRAERRGIAKVAAVAYTTGKGQYVGRTKQEFGFSHERKWTVLFVASWTNDDLIPPKVRPSLYDVEAPNGGSLP